MGSVDHCIGSSFKWLVDLDQVSVRIAEMHRPNAPMDAIHRFGDKGNTFGHEFLVRNVYVIDRQNQRNRILTIGAR
jgi:hypothetical protein